MNKKSILFLEPKGAIFQVVKAALDQGYQVIAMTSDLNLITQCPSHYRSFSAEIHETVEVDSWENIETVFEKYRDLARRHSIVGVYYGLDAPAKVASIIRQSMKLPTTNPDVFNLILDKFRLRQFLVTSGLSELRCLDKSEISKLTFWPFRGAGYFKPRHGAGSLYVKRCHNLNDLKKAIEIFEHGNPEDPKFLKNYIFNDPDYFLEEEIEGELLSAEAISFGGHFTCLGLLSRILYSKDYTVEMGSCFPYEHPRAKEIIEKVQKLHKVLGFTDGPTHVEVIVSKNGRVELIDFNPRFVGADVIQSINHAYAIGIETELLKFAIGKQPEFVKSATNYSCLQYILCPKEVDRFDSLSIPDFDGLEFKTTFLEPGTIIKSKDRQVDYIGCYLTVKPTFRNASNTSQEQRKFVRVNDEFMGVF